MKKMTKVKWSLAMVMMMFMVTTVDGYAQRRQGPPPQQGERHQSDEGERERGPKIPNLTEEQKTQMKALHLETEKLSQPIHNEIGEKEARLKSITSASEIDLKEAGRVIQEISDLKVKLMNLRVEHLAKVKEVLTDEQELALNHQLPGRPERPEAGKHGFGRGR
ncbi:Spy/CpxP family protein refolding chaperone [Roseivirga sp.]|uniref:Spy/CpxP family protein refolding chaperone n=1 Tax=Roseivirga sp. TaxID=1964215 RepID=UPI003B52C293